MLFSFAPPSESFIPPPNKIFQLRPCRYTIKFSSEKASGVLEGNDNFNKSCDVKSTTERDFLILCVLDHSADDR